MDFKINTHWTSTAATIVDFGNSQPINVDLHIEWILRITRDGDRLLQEIKVTDVTGHVMLENGEELEPITFAHFDDGARYDFTDNLYCFQLHEVHIDSKLEFHITF